MRMNTQTEKKNTTTKKKEEQKPIRTGEKKSLDALPEDIDF